MSIDVASTRADASSSGVSSVFRFTSTPAGYRLTNPITGDVIREKNFDHGLEFAVDQTADFYPWGMADPVVFNISNSTGAMAVNLLPTGIVEVH